MNCVYYYQTSGNNDKESFRAIKEKLLEYEEKYRILTENMEDVVWRLDLQTMKFLYISPSVQRLCGYTPQAIMAQPLKRLLLPNSLTYLLQTFPARLERFERQSEEATPVVDILQQVCKGGTSVWTEVSTRICRRADGTLEIIGVSRNCNERKRQQEELTAVHKRLEAGRNFLRTMIDTAPCALYCLDREGKIIYINQRHADRLGVDRYSAEQHYLYEFLPLELYRKHAPLLTECLQGKRVSFVDEQPFPQHPNCKYVYGVYNPFINADGQVERIVVAAMDITEQKQIEEQLVEAQRIAKMSSWEWNLQKRKFHYSQGLRRLFALGEGKVKNSSYRFFLACVHPEDRTRLKDLLRQLVHEQVPIDWEFRIIHPDKSIKIMQSKADISMDLTGKPLKIIGTIIDITQQKQFEAIQQEASVRLREFAQTVPDVSFIIDEDKDIVEMFDNDQFVLGALNKNIIGKKLTQFMSEGTAEQFSHDLAYAISHTTLQFGEYMLDTAMGRRMFEIRIAPMTYRIGNKRTVACNARDSTDKNRTKKLLQLSYEKRRRRDILNDLVEKKMMPSHSVLDQAWRVNLNLAQALSCYVLCIEEWQGKKMTYWQEHRAEFQLLIDSIIETLESHIEIIIWETQAGICILCPVSANCKDNKEHEMSLALQFKERIHVEHPDVVLSIGIAEFQADGFQQIATMYLQACNAAHLGKKMCPNTDIHHYLDLGVFQIISSVSDDGQIKAFIHRTLGKLLEYDEKRNSEFVITLEKILQTDNLKLVGERMFLHHKTVVFRKKRIEKILEISLDDYETRLTLNTALKLRQVLYENSR